MTGLDQLRVSVDQLSAQMLTPTTPRRSRCRSSGDPASRDGTSPATITIDGASNGQGVATSGPQAVAFTAGATRASPSPWSPARSGDGGRR